MSPTSRSSQRWIFSCIAAARLLSLYASLALLAGCASEPVGKVEGKVTLDGKPLAAGSILFNDQAGNAVRANLSPDGSYKVVTFDKAGLPPGSYRVAISPTVVGSGETPLAGKPLPEAPANLIPARYSDFKTSGLTAAVKAGANPPFEFALSSK
jgi:hypothetical protein